jgi:hypothetical protein
MTSMLVQAMAHGMHRQDSPLDIVIFGVIGVTMLALLPGKATRMVYDGAPAGPLAVAD